MPPLAADIELIPSPAVPERPPALVDALNQFVEEVGLLPTSGYFLEWCRRKDIPTARLGGGWASMVTDLRQQRAARGARTPDCATSARNLPPLPTPEPRVRRMEFRHSREAILISLRTYGELHRRPGEMPRQKQYLTACRKDPALIWPSGLARHGRFHDLCLEAGIE